MFQGKNYWTQFLRIRIAAEMDQKDGITSTDELRKQSRSGSNIEVSGYQIGAALALQLDELHMPENAQLKNKEIHLFEILANPEANSARAITKFVEETRSNGGTVSSTTVVGPSFWQVHERELAPDLIAATSALTTEWTKLALRKAAQLPALAPSRDSSAYPVVFPCGTDQLSGFLHRGSPDQKTGVVIVVAGGPQYRVGAHRQFVALARRVAAEGYPALRFDLRGMGDSSGQHRGYQHSREDISAAIDQLMAAEPQLEKVVLFGECSSASGILFYAYRDPRVNRIALVNPWLRTHGGQAEVILKHYYLDRLTSKAFWKYVLTGKFNPLKSAASFFEVLTTYLRGRKTLRTAGPTEKDTDIDNLPLPVKTAEGLRRFSGPALILMSGHDYIAREFDEVTKSSQAWAGLLSDRRVKRVDIAGADHTFSKAEWKSQAQNSLLDWMKETS